MVKTQTGSPAEVCRMRLHHQDALKKLCPLSHFLEGSGVAFWKKGGRKFPVVFVIFCEAARPALNNSAAAWSNANKQNKT